MLPPLLLFLVARIPSQPESAAGSVSPLAHSELQLRVRPAQPSVGPALARAWILVAVFVVASAFGRLRRRPSDTIYIACQRLHAACASECTHCDIVQAIRVFSVYCVPNHGAYRPQTATVDSCTLCDP